MIPAGALVNRDTQSRVVNQQQGQILCPGGLEDFICIDILNSDGVKEVLVLNRKARLLQNLG